VTASPHQVSKVALRRLAIIEALVKPETYPRLHAQFKRKRVELVRLIARQAGIGQRTVYHYLERYNRRGIEGLADSPRIDRGRPRALNMAACNLLLKFALPTSRGYLEPSVAEIWRAYNAELEYRLAHKNTVLNDEFSKAKYRLMLDGCSRLKDDAQLPAISYETARYWLGHIADLASFQETNASIQKSVKIGGK
jgi:hypothetical protein